MGPDMLFSPFSLSWYCVYCTYTPKNCKCILRRLKKQLVVLPLALTGFLSYIFARFCEYNLNKYIKCIIYFWYTENFCLQKVLFASTCTIEGFLRRSKISGLIKISTWILTKKFYWGAAFFQSTSAIIILFVFYWQESQIWAQLLINNIHKKIHLLNIYCRFRVKLMIFMALTKCFPKALWTSYVLLCCYSQEFI